MIIAVGGCDAGGVATAGFIFLLQDANKITPMTAKYSVFFMLQ